MSCPIDEEHLGQLKIFVALCKKQPMVIHHPKLSFFKDYLTSLGVNLPTATFDSKNFTAGGDNVKEEKMEDPLLTSGDETEPESDVELDMEGVIEGDQLTNIQVMGDASKLEVSDEDRDLSDEKRSAAMMAFSEQKYEEAIALYSKAIELNPQSALLFAKRGQVYLKMNKPNACIKDCTRALELNCDSAAAYKFRGRAYRLLGKFEEAAHDLSESLKIDYDDQANEWFNEVKPNAEKLRQHKFSVQRKKEEKERRMRMRRARAAQTARAAAAAQAAAQTPRGGAAEMGGPGSMGGPGAAGFPTGISQEDFTNLLFDPDIMNAFQDPEIAVAFQDVSMNPHNFHKYQSNPKIAAVIEKLQSKMGKGAGPNAAAAGAGAGSGAAAPGMFSGFQQNGSQRGTMPSDDDVGLD